MENVEKNQNDMPIVSVILPAYNAERTCCEAISSVLNQSFEDFELIIVDDGSTDSTYELCKNISYKDHRIKLVHQENRGVSGARNTALKIASGKFVAFIDADDKMESTFLNEMVSAIQHQDADVVYCGYTAVSSMNTRVWLPELGIKDAEIGPYLISQNALNMLWNKLFKRELITEYFNEQISMGEDLEFIANYHQYVTKYAIVKKSLYFYTSDTMGSLTKNAKSMIDSIYNDVKSREKYLSSCGADLYYARDNVLGHLFFILSKSDSYNEYCANFQQIKENLSLFDIIKKSYVGFHNKVIQFCLLHDLNLVLYLIIKNKKK